jgi:DNA-binding Lrp family transcriptional regulator
MIYMSLDVLDMKIIQCLTNDARTTYRSMAEEAGVTVMLDYHKLGRAIKSFIGLKVQPAKLQAIVDHMRGHPDLQVLYRTSGDVDLLFEVIFEKMEDLNTFLENELALDGILGTVVTIVIGPYKRCPWTGL